MLGQLERRVQGIRGGGNGADGSDPEETERELDGIRGEDQHHVALPEAQTEQAVSELDHPRFELRERQRLVRVGFDEGGLVGVGGGVAEEEGDH